MNADGGYTYTPDPGYVGIDNIDYTMTDGIDEDYARLRITVVEPAAEFLVTAPDYYEVTQDDQLTVAAPGVLANDLVSAGLTPTVVGISMAPSHGTVLWQPDGSFIYTPEAGFSGVDEFRPAVHAGSFTEYPLVTITVKPLAPAGGELPGGPAEGGAPQDPTEQPGPDEVTEAAAEQGAHDDATLGAGTLSGTGFDGVNPVLPISLLVLGAAVAAGARRFGERRHP